MKEWKPEEIKQLRLSLGLTQTKFGELLGVTWQYVSYLEHGKKKPSKVLKNLLSIIEQQHLKEGGYGKRNL